jgi:hypothetical protein
MSRPGRPRLNENHSVAKGSIACPATAKGVEKSPWLLLGENGSHDSGALVGTPSTRIALDSDLCPTPGFAPVDLKQDNGRAPWLSRGL